jgi:hypothetical protein
MYPWKCHSEAPCAAFLYDKKCQGMGLAPVGGGEYKERVVGGWIGWEYYVLVYENGKMRSVESIPGMGEGDKGEWWRGWIQVWYIGRILVNVTMYPQFNNNFFKVSKY